MELSKSKMKKLFPYLLQEIEENKDSQLKLVIRKKHHSKLSKYSYELKNPDVISFIRRCRTKSEALEIIDYCERRGEISSEYAEELREQLEKKGLRSFGPYKPPGYYFKLGKVVEGFE
ncbi:MAG: DUF2095 family protein [Candidatus Asgardarchaeia archaeon]